ncbi:flippase [Clostridium saudiense]|uniref:flippase n=1 Tax=Clostridium saudiense TaxID=1414720 RepID=UPI0018AB4F69|nr:flippase [Clostridium saudiense]
MSKKSLKINAILSGLQKLLSIIFPLVTFPYVSRVLGVENMGMVNFSASIISYFNLLAALGINNYATREGAKLRNNKKELNKFASEILLLNLISTIISYILLFILVSNSRKLQSYNLLLFIQSISILGATIGVNWMYQIYEEYLYIAIRALIVQVISMILIFIFVREKNDFIIYSAISLFANIGANIFNFIYAKKYVDFKIKLNFEFIRHLKPVLILFFSSIAISIYVDSDTVLLGWFCGDYSVGLYSVAVKIYSILKQIITAMVIVSLPRLTNYLYNSKINEYKTTVSKIFYYIILLSLPILIGIVMLSSNIIAIIAGEGYYESATALSILGFSMFFAVLSSFVTYAILLPLQKEKIQLLVTIISAIINILLNFILIPIFAQNGAAFTTLVAELLMFTLSVIILKNKESCKGIFVINKKDIPSIILANIYIIVVIFIVKSLQLSLILESVLSVITSIIGYLVILLVLKNSIVIELFKKFKFKSKYQNI